MDWSLRQRLKQNDFVNIAYRLLTNKRYREYCADYGRNPRIFRFEHLGEENPGKNIYFVEDGFQTSGMFALVIRALQRLEVADRFHFTPVLVWNDKVPYNIPGQPNTFLSYFLPVSDITVESAEHSQDVVIANGWDRAYGEAENTYEVSQGEIDRLAVIYQKYMKPRPEIQEKIDQEMKDLFGNVLGKVLGVHVRGVDWRSMNVHLHPIPVTEEDYVQAARDMMDMLGYEKMFLASDSDGTIDLFRREFGDRLITTQAARAPVGTSELAIFDEKNDRYQMGYEILRDAYVLAACDSFLCGISNVSNCTRIINKATKTPYEKVMVLDKGRVEKGMSVQASLKKQKKEIEKRNS